MVSNNTIAKSPYRRSYLKTRSEKGLVSVHSVFISRYVPKQTDNPREVYFVMAFYLKSVCLTT